MDQRPENDPISPKIKRQKKRKKKLIGQRAKIPYEEGIVNTVKGLDIPLPKYNWRTQLGKDLTPTLIVKINENKKEYHLKEHMSKKSQELKELGAKRA